MEQSIIQLPFLDDEWDAAFDDSETDAIQDGKDTNRTNGKSNTQKLNGNASDITASEQISMTDSEQQKTLSPEEQARLHSLKSMLDASNARYEQATKNRRPVFAAGLEVRVTRGDHAGKKGIVLDADYIENRALISLPDQESPHWIDFKLLGHAD